MASRGFGVEATKKDTYATPITLPRNDVRLTVEVEPQNGGPAVRDDVLLRWAGGSVAPAAKGDLYAVLVGVSDYRAEQIEDLRWAHKDAQDLGRLLKSQEGQIYRKVETRVLTNEQASRDAIVEALYWLDREVSREDVAVLFLSGHGVTDERRDYYFLPHDSEIDPSADTLFPKISTTMRSHEIKASLERILGHALFFFDSCHSVRGSGIRFKSLLAGEGGQDLNRVIADLASAEASIFVMSSSDGRELSKESDQWKNGAFKKALKEGIGGNADILYNDGFISFDELFTFVKDRVKELTNGRQHPVRQIPDAARDLHFFSALQ